MCAQLGSHARRSATGRLSADGVIADVPRRQPEPGYATGEAADRRRLETELFRRLSWVVHIE